MPMHLLVAGTPCFRVPLPVALFVQRWPVYPPIVRCPLPCSRRSFFRARFRACGAPAAVSTLGPPSHVRTGEFNSLYAHFLWRLTLASNGRRVPPQLLLSSLRTSFRTCSSAVRRPGAVAQRCRDGVRRPSLLRSSGPSSSCSSANGGGNWVAFAAGAAHTRRLGSLSPKH